MGNLQITPTCTHTHSNFHAYQHTINTICQIVFGKIRWPRCGPIGERERMNAGSRRMDAGFRRFNASCLWMIQGSGKLYSDGYTWWEDCFCGFSNDEDKDGLDENDDANRTAKVMKTPEYLTSTVGRSWKKLWWSWDKNICVLLVEKNWNDSLLLLSLAFKLWQLWMRMNGN